MFSKLSPNLARKGGHQQITGSEADAKDRIIAGVQFAVRYIGSTEVAGGNGTGSGKTEKPVAQVFDQHRRKKNGKTQKKMILTVCSKNLSVNDEACGKLVASFPIAKITFCNIDKFYEKAFVFVARDKAESPFKAFVFTCESKAKAKDAFKALSLAFIINYETYQASLARGASNVNETTSNRSTLNGEQKSTFFNGMAEAGNEIKSADKSGEKNEQLHCNGVMSSPKEPCVQVTNGFHSRQESTPSTLLTRSIQNGTLLQVPEYRRHVRSVSDPTQFGKIRLPVPSPSPLTVDTPTTRALAPISNGDTAMEEEFTQFAELRSKCRSSSAIDNNDHSGSHWDGVQRYDSTPNVWGGFQSACPAIY